jgi:hypothetical protein
MYFEGFPPERESPLHQVLEGLSPGDLLLAQHTLHHTNRVFDTVTASAARGAGSGPPRGPWQTLFLSLKKMVAKFFPWNKLLINYKLVRPNINHNCVKSCEIMHLTQP